MDDGIQEAGAAAPGMGFGQAPRTRRVAGQDRFHEVPMLAVGGLHVARPLEGPAAQQQQFQGFATPAPPEPVPAADPFFASSAPAFAQPPAPASFSSDPFGLPSQPPAPSTTSDYAAPTPAFAANGAGQNVVLTMGSLSANGLLAGSDQSAPGGGGGGGTLADKALQNLMGSIDSFGLSGKPATAYNPFDSSNNITSNATLGEIKSTKAVEKKPVMNAPPGPGALVMATNQGGNWGGFGAGGGQQQAQYRGMGGSMQPNPQYAMSGGYPQQQPQMGMGMQQSQMGMQQSQMGMQQPQMGMQQPQMAMQQSMTGMQQPQMGMMQGQQPPMQQQSYGAPSPYGQQPPTQQQNQWGTPFF